MTNPFSIFWTFITLSAHKMFSGSNHDSRSEDKLEDESDHEIAPLVWKLLFTSLLLIVALDFYIDIQNVPHLQTSIEGTYVYSHEPNNINADVSVTYNFGNEIKTSSNDQ